MWINITPTVRSRRSRPKPAWVPVRGSPEWWVANVKPGRVLFEVAGVNESLLVSPDRAIHKLP